MKDPNDMPERLESLKAGIFGGLSMSLTFVITSFLNNLLLAKYFVALSILQLNIQDDSWWVSGAISCFCGLLFGVTYRYIIRSDDNPQLKAGGVLAFGLVRGLTQIDVGFCCYSTILPFVVLAAESIVWFALCAIALDTAIQFGFLKPFKST
ncbi:hypothetical protein OGM63_16230 [Plectonema radiosum NIES-515]|uniref:Uncharacterized protein n=1 Tax=Plectonema radiosum NIES-515 TaxID=2986073 RepID=A0ABT3B0Y7_9CYAN|nr:hypothetical protein [Plectonema radiosum]MCV3215041.1 hypothetical protein [Plectonema radiosum NIES-515]